MNGDQNHAGDDPGHHTPLFPSTTSLCLSTPASILLPNPRIFSGPGVLLNLRPFKSHTPMIPPLSAHSFTMGTKSNNTDHLNTFNTHQNWYQNQSPYTISNNHTGIIDKSYKSRLVSPAHLHSLNPASSGVSRPATSLLLMQRQTTQPQQRYGIVVNPNSSRTRLKNSVDDDNFSDCEESHGSHMIVNRVVPPNNNSNVNSDVFSSDDDGNGEIGKQSQTCIKRHQNVQTFSTKPKNTLPFDDIDDNYSPKISQRKNSCGNITSSPQTPQNTRTQLNSTNIAPHSSLNTTISHKLNKSALNNQSLQNQSQPHLHSLNSPYRSKYRTKTEINRSFNAVFSPPRYTLVRQTTLRGHLPSHPPSINPPLSPCSREPLPAATPFLPPPGQNSYTPALSHSSFTISTSITVHMGPQRHYCPIRNFAQNSNMSVFHPYNPFRPYYEPSTDNLIRSAQIRRRAHIASFPQNPHTASDYPNSPQISNNSDRSPQFTPDTSDIDSFERSCERRSNLSHSEHNSSPRPNSQPHDTLGPYISPSTSTLSPGSRPPLNAIFSSARALLPQSHLNNPPSLSMFTPASAIVRPNLSHNGSNLPQNPQLLDPLSAPMRPISLPSSSTPPTADRIVLYYKSSELPQNTDFSAQSTPHSNIGFMQVMTPFSTFSPIFALTSPHRAIGHHCARTSIFLPLGPINPTNTAQITASPSIIKTESKLVDDYYISIMDWSPKYNLLAIGIQDEVRLFNMNHILPSIPVHRGTSSAKFNFELNTTPLSAPKYPGKPLFVYRRNNQRPPSYYSQAVTTIPVDLSSKSYTPRIIDITSTIWANQYIALGTRFGDILLVDCETQCVVQSYLNQHIGRIGAMSFSGYQSIPPQSYEYFPSKAHPNFKLDQSDAILATPTSIPQQYISETYSNRRQQYESLSLLASGGKDGKISIFDTRCKERILSVSNHNIITRNASTPQHPMLQEVVGLKWSYDGLNLAAGGNDNNIKVYDIFGQKKIFSKHSAAVRGLAWSPYDLQLLASGGGTADRNLCIWDTEHTQAPIPDFSLDILDDPTPPALLRTLRCGNQICNLIWGRRGRKDEIITAQGYSQNRIEIFSWLTGENTCSITGGHTSRPIHIAIDPTGQWLASAAGDKTIQFTHLTR